MVGIYSGALSEYPRDHDLSSSTKQAADTGVMTSISTEELML
jgi:hypothetical protein